MCKKASLRLSLTCLNGFALATAFVCLGLGVWLIVETDFHTAYGGAVKNWGGSLVFCAVACATTVYFGLYGTYRHNKFALTVALLATLFVVAVLFFTGIAIIVAVQPTHSSDTVQRCLERPPVPKRGVVATQDPCLDYFTSLQNVKMFRLWVDLFVRSASEATVKALLVNLENDNFCCGWGPPFGCISEDVSGNHSFPLNGEDLLRSNKPTQEALRRCIASPGWYVPSTFCERASDDPAVPDLGCPYLFPVNSLCASNGGNRVGCALVFQQSLASQLTGVAAGCMVLVALQLVNALATCCYCFKRKSTDVLPPFKSFVDERFEKYRYGVPGQSEPMAVTMSDSESGQEDEEAATGKGKSKGTPEAKPGRGSKSEAVAVPAGAVETKAAPGNAAGGGDKGAGVGVQWADS